LLSIDQKKKERRLETIDEGPVVVNLELQMGGGVAWRCEEEITVKDSESKASGNNQDVHSLSNISLLIGCADAATHVMLFFNARLKCERPFEAWNTIEITAIDY
jgi:hypothetical protein